MTTREDLRRDGTALRRRLFGDGALTHFVPNYADLRAELAFGAVWNRPGLALSDRMIASLAALCSVQRLNHLRRHIVAALDMELAPRTIVEIFIQCGIYCGLPASEEAMAVAEAVYAERGIALPEEAPRDDPIEVLDQRGRALMEAIHGTRAYSGYAAAENPVTQALYPVAIQYGYSEIWDRPGLDRRQRALITVAAFTALKLDGQVQKFGQSALSAGLSKTEIIETVIQTGPYSGLAPALNALSLLSEALR
ncbi:MAG TPA: carboxymuconolactone decarboxylase family protein [Stellaceae bacterium]|jgi:4-carboxymuconolactone decarboxylase|nr:carboxymuconolactone decarboxylase family protein [Stellaceae bacterium]